MAYVWLAQKVPMGSALGVALSMYVTAGLDLRHVSQENGGFFSFVLILEGVGPGFTENCSLSLSLHLSLCVSISL